MKSDNKNNQKNRYLNSLFNNNTYFFSKIVYCNLFFVDIIKAKSQETVKDLRTDFVTGLNKGVLLANLFVFI